jgi:hypothetical protein
VVVQGVDLANGAGLLRRWNRLVGRATFTRRHAMERRQVPAHPMRQGQKRVEIAPCTLPVFQWHSIKKKRGGGE